MIVWPAPPLGPAEAARAVAAGADPVWLCSPGGAEVEEMGVAVDYVAADPGKVVENVPVAVLERAWASARRAWTSPGTPGPPADLPIAVGWLSYDLGRRWMRLPPRVARHGAGNGNGDDNVGGDGAGGWPDLHFRFFDAVWRRQVGSAEAHILARDEVSARRLLERLLEHAAGASAPAMLGPLTPAGAGGPGAARAAHARAVARIKEYLHAGDAYQVNLARRLTAPMAGGDPLWLPAALRSSAPAAHGVWLGIRSRAGGPIDRGLVGNSPERFLRVSADGLVETRPIKGTRPRGATLAEDAAARAALAASPKDRAEHVMIVDLERNDLGRVCRTGSVVVQDLLRVMPLPTLFHLVSTVRGRLRADVDLEAVLAATFPGGSVTGAPKRRAMEIIDELEPAPRGVYTGATGWLGAAGDLDLAVAIRTATIAGGRLSLFVGGGIVADSDAAAEWEETEVKARAFANLW